MKRKLFGFFLLLLVASLLNACSSRTVYQPVPVNQAANGVQVRQDVNLDPTAALNLVAGCHSAQEYQERLATSGIWNISTAGNGQLDIPKVIETAPNGVRTFTILAFDPNSGQDTFIANVPFSQQGANQAVIAFNGNPAYYSQPNYSITMPIAEILMWHYLFSPHPYYAPVGWGVGYRPAYYSSMPRYRSVTEMTTVTRQVVTRPAQAQAAPAVKVTTPYDNKVSTAAKAAQVQRANPMAGRSFNEKNTNQSIRVGPNTAGVKSAQQNSAAASAGSSSSSSKPSSGFGFGSNRSSSSSSSSSSISRSSSSSSSNRSSSVPRRR